MKTLLTILCMVAIASVAWADKPVQTIDNPIDRVQCPFENITYDWNFAVSDWGFTTASCDDGGVPVWEYGVNEEIWPDPIWGTVTLGVYPNNAGDSLISPSFMVDESAYLVEFWHWYEIEPGYDGGNLSVNGVIIEPMVDPYPDGAISDNPEFYAWCVEGEPGYNGGSLQVVAHCFDLSAFIGEEVQLSFDFGSDSTVQYLGWYTGRILVGGDVVANDGTTWSAVKELYR